jgi:hypothetical protein
MRWAEATNNPARELVAMRLEGAMTPAEHLMVAGGGDATDYFFIGRS